VNPLIDHHCCYKCGNSLNDFFCHLCTCEFCGNGAHVGYNCPSQVPSFQTLPSFPQQFPCCEDCDGLSEADHYQPEQYTFNHPIFNAHNDLLNTQTKLMEQVTSMCEMFGQFIQKKHEEEQANDARYWKIPACFDDDDDYNFAITPNEPDNSSSRPPKEFVSENSDVEIESFSPSPIRVEDSDSLMEEINLSFTPDDPMPPGIEKDDYDSERDILIYEELLDNHSLSLPKKESFHF
nr:hypothetical protein [Tanacetum cinerariifolium]